MKLGMDLRLCGPRELWPEQKYATELLDIASTTNAKLRVCQDQSEALPGADFVYTDVWLSMAESKDKWSERIRLLEPFRVTSESLLKTGNPHVKFMHCLPAFHDRGTMVGGEIAQKFGITCMEVKPTRYSRDRPRSSSTKPRTACIRSRLYSPQPLGPDRCGSS
jgi:ornithine carbamoyltransferase